MNLSKARNRKTNSHHTEAIVLSAKIAHQLGMKIASFLEKQIGRARLNFEKLDEVLAGYILKAKSFRELLKSLSLTLDPFHGINEMGPNISRRISPHSFSLTRVISNLIERTRLSIKKSTSLVGRRLAWGRGVVIETKAL